MIYIQRDLENIIKKYLNSKEIIAIVGTRQCGKTTLLKKIAKDIETIGKKVKFITFDDLSVLQLFEQDIESFIQLYVKPFNYLFIDEIQYARDNGKKLKFIYDTAEIKIFISGSSAVDISVQSLKYLVGRIFTFVLYPFSFREFLRSKDENFVAVFDKSNYGKALIEKFNSYLREFLLFGGFPRVVTSQEYDEKKLVLKNIYNTYLLREIRDIFQISHDYKILKLLKSIALQIGNLINYNELSIVSETNIPELKKYLNILQKTYILSLVQPFYTNKRTEVVKTPKVYFIDPGFRNICIDVFSESLMTGGENIEQFVFSEFLKRDIILKYWRSKSRAEVDFVFEKDNIVPIEVKKNINSPGLSKSFYSFINKYQITNAYILSLNYSYQIKKGKTNVIFSPVVKYNNIINV